MAARLPGGNQGPGNFPQMQQDAYPASMLVADEQVHAHWAEDPDCGGFEAPACKVASVGAGRLPTRADIMGVPTLNDRRFDHRSQHSHVQQDIPNVCGDLYEFHDQDETAANVQCFSQDLNSKNERILVLERELEQAILSKSQLHSAVQHQQVKIEEQDRELNHYRSGAATAVTAAHASALAEQLRTEKDAIHMHAKMAADSAADGMARLAQKDVALQRMTDERDSLERQLREVHSELAHLQSASNFGATERQCGQCVQERTAAQAARKELHEAQDALRRHVASDASANNFRESLRRELDAARSKNLAQESELESLRHEVEVLNTRAGAASKARAIGTECLGRDLEAANARVRASDAEAAQLRLQIDSAHALAAQHEAELAQLRGRRDASWARNQMHEAEVDEIRNAAGSAYQRQAVLTSELEQLRQDKESEIQRSSVAEAKLKAVTSEKNTIETEMTSLRGELLEVRISLDKTKAENARQEETLRITQDELLTQTNAANFLRDQSCELEQRMFELQAEHDAKVAGHARELEEANHRCNQIQSLQQLEDDKNAREDLARELTQTQDRVRFLETQASFHKEEMSSSASRLKELQAQRDQHAQDFATKTLKLEHLETRNAELEAQLESFKLAEIQKEVRLQELQAQTQDDALKSAGTAAQLHTLELQIRELETKNETYAAELALKSRTLDELETRAKCEALDAASQTARIQELEAQICDLEAAAESNAIQTASAATQLQDVEAQKMDLEVQVHNHIKEIAEWHARVKDLEGANYKMAEDANRAQEQAKEQANTEFQTLKEEFDRIRAADADEAEKSLRGAKEEAAAQIEYLNQELERTKAEIEERESLAYSALKDEQERAAAKLDATNQLLAKAKDDMNWIDTERQVAMSDREELEEQLKAKDEEAKQLQQEERERSKLKVKRMMEELEKMKAEKKMQEQEEVDRKKLVQEKERFEAQTQVLKDELESVKTQIERYSSDLSAKDMSMREQETRLHDLEANVAMKDVLQKQLEETQAELAQARGEVRDMRERSDQDRTTYEVQRSEDRDEIDRLTVEIERLTRAAVVRQESWQKEDAEIENTRSQCRELSQTLQQFKHDYETMLIESGDLQEKVKLFEDEFMKAADANAQLAGSQNPNQRIKFVAKLKDEKNQLRADLENARKRIHHLELNRQREYCAVTLFEAFVSLDIATCATEQSSRTNTPLKTPTKKSTTTPRRSPSSLSKNSPTLSKLNAKGGSSHSDHHYACLSGPEAIRRCQMQERKLERISADFCHLVFLVEQVVMQGEGMRGSRTERHATGFAQLLQRLRDLAQSQTCLAQGASSSPRATLAIVESSTKPTSHAVTAAVTRRSDDALPLGHSSSSPTIDSRGFLKAHSGDGGFCHRGGHAGTYILPEHQPEQVRERMLELPSPLRLSPKRRPSLGAELDSDEEGQAGGAPREATEDLCRLLETKGV